MDRKVTSLCLVALLTVAPACSGKVGQYDTMQPTDKGGAGDGPRVDGPRKDGPRKDGPRKDGPLPGDTTAPKDAKANEAGCFDECPTKGFKGCRAGGVVTCGQHDPDPCLDWGKPSTCSKTMGPATCGTNSIARQITACLAGKCKKLDLRAPCPFGCLKGQCVAPPAGSGGKMVTLWRWFHPKTPNHLTSNDIKEQPSTATFQGQSFYVPAANASGRYPLYRLHRKDIGDHMVSLNKTEAAPSYKYEATLGYPFSKKITGTVELRRWNNAKTFDHLLAFAHENPATMGYTKEGVMGHGYARPGNSAVKLSTVSAAGVSLSANPAAGGAVWSLTHGGMQLINQQHFGRALQVRLNLSGKAGTDTPTEAGSKHYLPTMAQGYRQGSPLIASSTAGGTLGTSCRPLQWDPDLHGGGKGYPVVWGGFFAKEVEPNFQGLGAVVRWTSLASLPKASKYLEAEVASATLVKELSRFWAYDVATGKLVEVTAQVPSGGCLGHTKDPRLKPKAGGVIVSTPDQKSALGIYRARGQRLFRVCRSAGGTGGSKGSGYSRCSALEQHPKGVSAGTQIWTAYVVVGSVAGCKGSMDKLYAAGL